MGGAGEGLAGSRETVVPTLDATTGEKAPHPHRSVTYQCGGVVLMQRPQAEAVIMGPSGLEREARTGT